MGVAPMPVDTFRLMLLLGLLGSGENAPTRLSTPVLA
jgi:hypothetical protein